MIFRITEVDFFESLREEDMEKFNKDFTDLLELMDTNKLSPEQACSILRQTLEENSGL